MLNVPEYVAVVKHVIIKCEQAKRGWATIYLLLMLHRLIYRPLVG